MFLIANFFLSAMGPDLAFFLGEVLLMSWPTVRMFFPSFTFAQRTTTSCSLATARNTVGFSTSPQG